MADVHRESGALLYTWENAISTAIKGEIRSVGSDPNLGLVGVVLNAPDNRGAVVMGIRGEYRGVLKRSNSEWFVGTYLYYDFGNRRLEIDGGTNIVTGSACVAVSIQDAGVGLSNGNAIFGILNGPPAQL